MSKYRGISWESHYLKTNGPVALLRAGFSDHPEVMTARLASSNASTARRPELERAGGTFNAVQAAEESCRIVGQTGFYPGRLVDQAYIQRFTPIMEQRLQMAGARLAVLINLALP